MVGKVDLVSDAEHKRDGGINALCFDGKHLYSGSEDGAVTLWTEDLKFVRNLIIHKTEGERFAVLCLVINKYKQLYSSARDGTLRFFRRAWSHDHNDVMLQTAMVDITAIALSRNTNTLYSGDDNGIITKWYHNQVGCQYNVLEAIKGLSVEVGGQYNNLEDVKSLAIEGYNLYTVRDAEVTVTDIKPGLHEQTVKGRFPGRFPLLLAGPDVAGPDGIFTTKHRQFIIAATLDGKGFSVATNDPPYDIIKTKENAHSMIINAMIINPADPTILYTGSLDGKVKKWKNLGTDPTVVEEIDTGKCINCLCLGPDSTLYAGDSEGFIRRLRFSE